MSFNFNSAISEQSNPISSLRCASRFAYGHGLPSFRQAHCATTRQTPASSTQISSFVVSANLSALCGQNYPFLFLLALSSADFHALPRLRNQILCQPFIRIEPNHPHRIGDEIRQCIQVVVQQSPRPGSSITYSTPPTSIPASRIMRSTCSITAGALDTTRRFIPVLGASTGHAIRVNSSPRVFAQSSAGQRSNVSPVM